MVLTKTRGIDKAVVVAVAVAVAVTVHVARATSPCYRYPGRNDLSSPYLSISSIPQPQHVVATHSPSPQSAKTNNC